MAKVGRQRSCSDHLPAEVTSFVGRREEISQVRRLLATARLVTLTGVGGSGKTRLALRVARQVQRAFPDGVWLADVSSLTDGSLLDYYLVQALGINESGDGDLRKIILSH